MYRSNAPSYCPSDRYYLALKCFVDLLLPHLRSTLSPIEGVGVPHEVSENKRTTCKSVSCESVSCKSDSSSGTAETEDASSFADSASLGAIKFCESIHSKKHSALSSQPSKESTLTRISIMSYNVFFHPRQGQDRAARRKHLVDALGAFEGTFHLPMPDVIAFQEVDDAFVDDDGLKALYPHRTKRVSMNVIASKYPILDFKQFEDQPGNMMTTIDVSKKDCGLLHCVCASLRGSKTKRVHLLNVHLHAGNFESGHETRVKEYEELERWISSMNIPENEPVIIAGDFNDETDDLKDMKEWVVNYDHAKTGTFDGDGKYRLGSWSSRANWLVALHFQSRYKYYPRGYTKTIDYIAFDKRFLAPVESAEMRVLLMKSRRPWKYACEGPSPWCDDPAMRHLRGKWEASTWFEGGGREGSSATVEKLYHGTMEKGDDMYDELSDHFPVYQEYGFRF